MATNGPDTLFGTDGADTISGLAGNDVIYGMSGASQSPLAGRINVVRVGTGFSNVPVYASSAPGDPSHLYVITKDDGNIWRLDPATGQRSLFQSVTSFLGNGERGVLSLAFHPGYAAAGANHGRFFVYLTNLNGDIEVREYDADNGVNGGPVKTVITIPHPIAGNHNGGSLVFGPNDGYLYVSTGDGGGGNDQFHNSQDLTKLLGKILRIDINGDDFPSDSTKNYAIPAGNPFVGSGTAAHEIWAYGLRNPFRISFDTNGDLYIGDVGQATREEIDFQPAAGPGGRNYGWPAVEGTLVHATSPPGAVPPIFEYDHTLGNVVTGGAVYREAGQPLFGSYFFIDEGSNRFWTLKVVNGHATGVIDRTGQLFSPVAPVSTITSFGQDGHGNIYMVGFGGDIFRLDMTAFAGDLGDRLHGGAGNDRIFGGPGNDALYGDRQSDLLGGGYGNDLLVGGPGNDRLDGGPGADTMIGGPGNDTYFVNAATDIVQEATNAGRDTVESVLSMTLPENTEVLHLMGTAPIAGAGNAAANRVVGNANGNVLSGAAGNDFINGQGGADGLGGGAGRDGFLFNTVLGAGNVDRIFDFDPANDTIYLQNAVFHGLAVGKLPTGAFFIGAGAHDADDRIIYDRSTGALIFDADGNQSGGGVQFATIVNHAALTSADFLVY